MKQADEVMTEPSRGLDIINQKPEEVNPIPDAPEAPEMGETTFLGEIEEPVASKVCSVEFNSVKVVTDHIDTIKFY